MRRLLLPELMPIDLDLAPGECLAVTGPSGAGKTLLLRALADLDERPGEIALNGTGRYRMPAPAWRAQVGYVAAEPGWWHDTPMPHFADPASASARLGAVGLGPGIMQRRLAELSTGERQRLALIRAYILAPRVLLLDEPTGPLDEASTLAVEDLLRGFCADGGAVIIVSHDRDQVARLCRRVLALGGGTWTLMP